jgi:CRISPR-associated protein Csx16
MATWFVSRHPGAVAWAAGQGLRVDHLVPHLTVTQVQSGDTVIGNLTVHLAAQICARGAHFLNLSMDIPAHWRGYELSPEQLTACNARLEAFNVTSI